MQRLPPLGGHKSVSSNAVEALFPFSCAFLLGDLSIEVLVAPLVSKFYHPQHGEERMQGGFCRARDGAEAGLC